MEKVEKQPVAPPSPAARLRIPQWLAWSSIVVYLLCSTYYYIPNTYRDWGWGVVGNTAEPRAGQHSPYGSFPVAGDPFLFIPCTSNWSLPALDDPKPQATWAAVFDPDPSHWSWGNRTSADELSAGDPYYGRGIYLCGYLDVPLDYSNESDSRIVRLAVAKFQVSGLARVEPDAHCAPQHHNGTGAPGSKSARTIVIEPGGPGGSGTNYVWRVAETVTKRFSDSTFDVLGWDPRGVNATLPAIGCYPYSADRDRWSLLSGQYLEVSGSPMAQLELADAMNNATFKACWELYGDLPRFVSTGLVARDLEEIRKAMGEDELTGYLVSYGTGIGQTYANMFPDSVGRMILDGTEYVRDHRLLGGFGWTALDNATNAWHDGFLGECLNAGPDHCALAKSRDGKPVVLEDLEARMKTLVTSLIDRPIPAYTKSSGPSLVTYSSLVGGIYRAMYNAETWPAMAQLLFELEDGNSTLAAAFLEGRDWKYDPTIPAHSPPEILTDELDNLVICVDAWDAPLPPDGLVWWLSLWTNMTSKAWISGNSRFFSVFPCRHFLTYWPEPGEVYRGDLNHTLKNPVLLIAEVYDPATPLRNGRRLLAEMGKNARLITHHGYGHSSRDTSNCTEAIARAYILNGTLPEEQDTACYANEKPYLYGVKKNEAAAGAREGHQSQRDALEQLALLNPRLLP